MRVETIDVAVFIAILAVYICTLSPTIAGGDSGELVAEGCILGTPHPPGYPLFLVMVHAMFRLRPLLPEVVPVAYLVNLSSAALTAAAAVMVAMICRYYTRGSVSCGLFAAGMFAFSPLIWQYAVTAEVFPLNTFLVALLVLVTLKFMETRRMSWVIAGAFISGLALCNQHTSVLFASPLILCVTLLIRKVLQRQPMYVAYIGCAFFAGLSPYLILPVVASIRANSGSWGDVLSFEGFVHHFLRRDYGTFQLFSGKTGRQNEGALERNMAYVADLQDTQGLHIVPTLALVGLLGCFFEVWVLARSKAPRASPGTTGKGKSGRNNKQQAPTDLVSMISEFECGVAVALLPPCLLVFYFAVFHSLSNLPLTDRLLYGIHQRFWMQPNLLTFTCGGIGMHYVFRGTAHLMGFASPTASPDSGRVRYSALPIVLATLLVLLQLGRWHFVSDQSGGAHFSEYAMAILKPLPRNSLLFINYDQQWTSIRYMQNCEGYRRDVTTINLSMMSYPWFEAKQRLYQEQQRAAGGPVMKFPGDRYGSQAGRVVGGTTTYYTTADIIRANIAKFDIFLSGKLSYTDPNLAAEFDYMPVGLASQFVPKAGGKSKTKRPTAMEYSMTLLQSMRQVLDTMPELPASDRYSEETWEWTIGRDFKDRLNDAAAQLLELAIAEVATYTQPLVASIYFLEMALQYERHFPRPAHTTANPSGKSFMWWEEYVRGTINTASHTSSGNNLAPISPPSSLLKNAGLAHMHAVQNQQKISDSDFALFSSGTVLQDNETHHSFDIFNITQYKDVGWPTLPQSGDEAATAMVDFRKWCVTRFVALWSEFLGREDSLEDPQYNTIKGIFEKATAALSPDGNRKATAGPRGADGTGAAATQSKKRKATKKKSTKAP